MYSIYYFCFLITLILALIFNYYINGDDDINIPGLNKTNEQVTKPTMIQPSDSTMIQPSDSTMIQPSDSTMIQPSDSTIIQPISK
jgi:hypothetical protein